MAEYADRSKVAGACSPIVNGVGCALGSRIRQERPAILDTSFCVGPSRAEPQCAIYCLVCLRELCRTASKSRTQKAHRQRAYV